MNNNLAAFALLEALRAWALALLAIGIVIGAIIVGLIVLIAHFI